MKTYSISQLARAFGLSRSTLLYYDRIGLLRAPGRTAAGYRLYTQNAGLPLGDVKKLLSSSAVPGLKILEDRIQELEDQILFLRVQQHSIIAMLKKMKNGAYKPVVDKTMWVSMLKAAGMDESSMAKWHAEFECRAPEAHKNFLLSLGISANDVRKIQEWSRGKKPSIG
jgi:DNA-binding transcriptional MerR regulator